MRLNYRMDQMIPNYYKPDIRVFQSGKFLYIQAMNKASSAKDLRGVSAHLITAVKGQWGARIAGHTAHGTQSTVF